MRPDGTRGKGQCRMTLADLDGNGGNGGNSENGYFKRVKVMLEGQCGKG